MNQRHTQRFPLMVGTRAYRLLATAPAWVALASTLSLGLAIVGDSVPVLAPLRVAGYVGGLLALALCISPFALLFSLRFVVGRLRAAVAVRACDLVIDGESMLVRGGRAGGFEVQRSQLRAVRMAQAALIIERTDGASLHVPTPDDAQERASLKALATVLLARVAVEQAPRSPREPVDILHCCGCGRPLAPISAASVRCPQCGRDNAVPPVLAAKLATAQTLERRVELDEKLASALLAQPGALAANIFAFAGGLLMLVGAALIAMLAGVTAVLTADPQDPIRLLPLLPFPLGVGGLALVVLGGVRRLLASRRALPILTFGFAAVPPTRVGAPASCRSCGGPLPEPDALRMLALCVYCGAENLRASDLRVHADIIERFSSGRLAIGDVLGDVARARRRASVLMLAGALSFATALVVAPFVAERGDRAVSR